jgi:hypothetical protein
MDEALRQLVWDRAHQMCEYCLLPFGCTRTPFEIDHIVSQKHRGKTVPNNLALACFYCNSYKGPNLSGIDPSSAKLVGLFNPRRHKWSVHFAWNNAVLIGKTSIGRATIEVLQINHPDAIAARASLIEESVFPPPSPPRISLA